MSGEPDYNDMTLDELAKLLSDRQRKFAEELLTDNNAAKAAERAGYSAKSAASQGSRMIRDPRIAAYRRKYAAALYAGLGITAAEVALSLQEVAARCMQGRPHMSWDSSKHEWVEDGTWVFDSKGAVSALKALGDNLGMFSSSRKDEQSGGALRVEIAPELEAYAK